MLEFWGMRSNPSLPSLPGPHCPGVVAPDRVISMGQIELNCVFMVIWIAGNRTVLTFNLHTYAKLNCLKQNRFCMLNWIVSNRTVFWHWNCVLMLNWIVWNRTVLKLNCVWTRNYTYTKTELSEIEFFICIKMDLVLMIYNGWCAIKPNHIY